MAWPECVLDIGKGKPIRANSCTSHIPMEAKRKAINGLTPVTAVASLDADGASRPRVN